MWGLTRINVLLLYLQPSIFFISLNGLYLFYLWLAITNSMWSYNQTCQRCFSDLKLITKCTPQKQLPTLTMPMT